MGSEILTPEGALLTDPGQVERALVEMWKQAGQAASGEAHKPAASRVCVANLIVVGAAERWDDILEVLGELSPVYPTRTIAVLLGDDDVGPGPTDRQEACSAELAGSTAVRASVTALCHVPQPGQPQVCCEQIVLRASQAQARDLHRTLLPLLESDVPVMVWWTLNPLLCGDLLGSLAGNSRRFILDAGLAGAGSLGSLAYESVRDLGWYRIHRWRELIASMFDECGARPLDDLQELVVEVGRPLGEALEAAVWLIAFFGGQLGWALRTADCESRDESSEPAARFARFAFAAGERLVKATIVPAEGEGLVGLVVRSDGNTFEARRGREELRIVVHEEHVCQTPRVVHLPRRRRSEALAAALTGRAVDAAFARAAPLAAWMAARLPLDTLPLHL